MNIKFIGAAREVTGSKHLITTDDGKKILLDCGMFQGKGLETDKKNRDLQFDPKDIDYVILSHAHIDHSGLIPYIYKLGFRGSVVCTSATRDLCSIMLPDSGHIQELDAKWYNKKADRKRLPHIDPIYDSETAEKCMELFIGVPFGRRFYINNQINVKFFHTGHLLGGAICSIEITEHGKKTNIAYTGDIGRPHDRLLVPPEPFPQCDYLITESTYGNRLHEPENILEDELYEVVKKTCIENHGKLLIPSFSVGRTQEIVFVLNKMYNSGKLPERIDVFVDSPLSVNATEIFRMHTDNMNADVKKVMETDPDPFGFNSLHYIKDVDESKRLNTYNNPCIIISASGMMEAGRIKHHVANSIADKRNAILIVGYCTPTSLGARIQKPGLRMISIFGEMHPVNANIYKIEGFSGHGDYQEMRDYLLCQNPKKIKKLFLVHGEYATQQSYKKTLYESGFENISIPAPGDIVELNKEYDEKYY